MVTLILLPGLDGTGTLFDAFVAALGTEFNVKVVSYPTTEPLDYSELEAIARSALPAEGPFVILGESFSGPTAVSLAASSSSQLKGLVLCCTFVRNPRPVFAIFKPLLGLLPIAFAPVSILIRLFLGRASTEHRDYQHYKRKVGPADHHRAPAMLPHGLNSHLLLATPL